MKTLLMVLIAFSAWGYTQRIHTDTLQADSFAIMKRLYVTKSGKLDSIATRTMTITGSPSGTPGDSCIFLNKGVLSHCSKSQVVIWIDSLRKSHNADSADIAANSWKISGHIWPSDGTNNQVLTTDGSGNYSFSDKSGGSIGTITSINGSSIALQTIKGEGGIVVYDSGVANYVHVIQPEPGKIIPTGANNRVDSSGNTDSLAHKSKAYFDTVNNGSRAVLLGAKRDTSAHDTTGFGATYKAIKDTASNKLGLHAKADNSLHADTADSAKKIPNIISAAGPIGTSKVTPVITYNAQGRLTTVTTATIIPDSTLHALYAWTSDSARATGWSKKTDSSTVSKNSHNSDSLGNHTGAYWAGLDTAHLGAAYSWGNWASNFGSSAGKICQGNDSRLSDSRPASDVYAWAKASTKPSYTYSEVGAQAPGNYITALTGDVTASGPGSVSSSVVHTNTSTLLYGDSLNVHGTVIQKNGNVGIGATAPASLLHLSKNAVDVYERFQSTAAGGVAWDIGTAATGGTAGPAGGFFIAKTGVGGIFVIDASGNVGIGTAAPTEKLTVKGNISDTGNITVDSLRVVTGVGGPLKVDSLYAIKCGTLTPDSLNVHGVVIQKNGNVGIGTTAPASLLHLSKNAVDVYERFQSTAAGGVAWDIGTAATGGTAGPAGGFFIAKTGVGGIFVIDASGNVGIGTAAPTEKLTVKGNISDTGNITTTGTVTSALDSTQRLAVHGNADFYPNGNHFQIGFTSGQFYLDAGGYNLSLGSFSNNNRIIIAPEAAYVNNLAITGKVNITIVAVELTKVKDTILYDNNTAGAFRIITTRSDDNTHLYVVGGNEGDGAEVFNTSSHTLYVQYGSTDGENIVMLAGGHGGVGLLKIGSYWYLSPNGTGR